MQSLSFKPYCQRGFSLLEVLIGLAILAIALSSGIKALSQIVETQLTVKDQYLGEIAANNALNKLYLEKAWPEISTTQSNCSQLNLVLTCVQHVFETPNPYFRRVEIDVYESSPNDPSLGNAHRLTSVSAVLFNYQTSSL
jgi:general secretion pathway protein I